MASCHWSSLRHRSIGSIDSSDSNPSVGVDFIVFRISDAASLWSDLRSFNCLALCILKSHAVQLNSSLDLIKALQSSRASWGDKSGYRVSLLYSILHFGVMCRVKVRPLSIMIPRTLFALTFVKEILLMVTRMEGGSGNFFLS